MKKSWTITILICLLLLGGGAVVIFWPRTVPFEQCSEIYQKYANVEKVKASFIKDFKVNDTVFVDVTLLEAIDSTGWDILKTDFKVPPPPLELQPLIDNGEDLLFTKHIPKYIANTSAFPYDLLVISHLTHTLTVIHINSEIEKYAVLNHNYKEEIIN